MSLARSSPKITAVDFVRRLTASLNSHKSERRDLCLGRMRASPPYILIYDYEPAEDAIVLLRILHERRNITAELVRRE